MAGNRPIVLVLGGGLATAGLVFAIVRLAGAASGASTLGALPTLPFYGTTAAAMLVGTILLFSAPTTRRRRRVTLDERPVEAHMTLRPGRPDAAPATEGTKDPTTTRTDPTPPDVKPHSQGGTATPTTPRTTGLPESNVRAQWGTHPNDPRRDASAPPPGGGPGATMVAPQPDVDRAADAEREARAHLRRQELLERLEALEQKANQAKVRFGLGKVSAAGYRQYLAEVDRERMMIESELMETEV